MSNISQLNDILFTQLERLNKDDLSDAQLDLEIRRTKAITHVSKQVIDAGRLSVGAEKVRQEFRGPSSLTAGPLLKELT